MATAHPNRSFCQRALIAGLSFTVHGKSSYDGHVEALRGISAGFTASPQHPPIATHATP